MDEFNHKLEINVPFQNARQSNIAKGSLSPDPVLKPRELQVKYETRDHVLVMVFESISARVLRVGVNSTLESLKTVIECMDEFDGKKHVVLE